jgi:signal transduction histidine kinase/DNA-binding response OmpR family regulator
MRTTSAFILSLVFSLRLIASTVWDPKVVVADNWRWTELDFLNDYHIIHGTSGSNGEVWFVHNEGILRYDGLEVQNYPVPRLAGESIIENYYISDGRIVITTESELIVWREGQVDAFGDFTGGIFIRSGVVECKDGRVLAATQRGIFEVRRDGLVRVETENERIDAILIDARGNLWVAENGRAIDVYALTTTEGNLVARLVHRFESSGQKPDCYALFMDSLERVWVLAPDESDRCYFFENYERKAGITGVRERGLAQTGLKFVEPKPGEFWLCASRRLAHWDGHHLQAYRIEDFPVPSSFPYILTIPGERILLGGRYLLPQMLDVSAQRWSTFAGLNFQCEGRARERWFIAEDRSILCHDGASWRVFTAADGVIDRANRVIATSDGAIWASGSHRGQAAAAVYRSGAWELFCFPELGMTFSHLAALETRAGEVVFGGGTPLPQLGERTGGAVVFREAGSGYISRHYPPPTFAQRPANIVEREGDGLLFSSGSVFKVRLGDAFVNIAKYPFSRQWIDHMIVDRRNELWVACMGVGLLSHDQGSWRVHGPRDGLDTKNVIHLLDDRQQESVLALTDKGFYHYDGVCWGKWGFPIGLALKRENHTVFQTSDGAVWLNFTNRPWLLEIEDSEQQAYRFESIRFMPDRKPPQTFATLTSASFPEGGQIQVRFQGADYWEETRRQDLVYSWSLDGSTWSSFAGEPSVIFDDLKSGAYELRVRARDMSGNIDGTPTTVRFSVVPPLWKRAWFILGMLLVVVSIGLLLYSLSRIRLKAALALDEFKLDFFTNISHELRNPLAVIISPLEMLLESGLEEKARLKIHLEQGRWTLNHEGGEIIGFTRDSVMNHEPLWQRKNQTVDMTFSRESFPCGFDVSILQKIIDNLISNAIKYSDEETVIRVRVSIDFIDGHDHYTLEVEDEGVGIPLHEQKNVLEPFYRIRRHTHREGSGVGLALVNQLVKLWGGSIDITSPLHERDRGTRLRVLLPLEPFEESRMAETADAGSGRNEDDRPTLLFVEDNDDMRHILVDGFSEGYRVIEARDGEAGFRLALGFNPDLVVSDVIMPGMDGNELCEKLKTSPETSHIPVVLLTARSSAEHRIEGIRSGADAYIGKPLDFRHLRVLIENLLQSRRELKKKFAKQLVIEATEITVTPTDEKILAKALRVVEDNIMDENFSVDRFAQLMGMSRSTLKRKLGAATGLSPQPFVQQLRLKRAARLLASGGIPVTEVARMVGFYDLSYFGCIFKKEFGSAPSHYAQSMNRENKTG